MSADDIREALTLGSDRRPPDYELLWSTGRDEQSQTVIGSVYTPFQRVAMWAHQRRLAGHAINPAAIPADLLRPVFLIAIRKEPACCPSIEPGPPIWKRAVLLNGAARPVMLCVNAIGQAALWEDSDLSYLRLFDEETATRTSFIAAFPLEDIHSGLRVGFEHHFRDSSEKGVRHFFGYGRISEEDIRRWR